MLRLVSGFVVVVVVVPVIFYFYFFFDYSFASYGSYSPYFQSLLKAYFMGQPSARAKHLNLRKSPSVYGKLHVISLAVVAAALLHTVYSSNVWP